jgi:hypothetical protein
VFEELFEVTEIANFSIEEWRRYQGSLKTYRDWYAIELTRQQELQAQEQEIQRLQQAANDLQQAAENRAQAALEAGLEQGRQKTIALITRQLSRRFQQELSEEMR